MARNLLKDFKKVEEKEVIIDIEESIENYAKAKEDEKDVKARVSLNGENIKKWLKDNNKSEYQGKNHKVSVSTSESVSYDDTALLKIARTLPEDIQEQLIEKIEVVNMEKLERLVVEGKLDITKFKDAEVVKTTTKLYCK